MKLVRVCLSAALLAAVVASDASAMPVATGIAPAQPAPVLARYGYGPLPHGLYGHRRRHHGRSYGTGYHGRGTRTGGPVGGLPSRN